MLLSNEPLMHPPPTPNGISSQFEVVSPALNLFLAIQRTLFTFSFQSNPCDSFFLAISSRNNFVMAAKGRLTCPQVSVTTTTKRTDTFPPFLLSHVQNTICPISQTSIAVQHDGAPRLDCTQIQSSEQVGMDPIWEMKANEGSNKAWNSNLLIE